MFQSPRRLVFAHRGGARLAPENTMPAFDNGMALGSDGLELDVQLSADGLPVVIHDKTLDRTTDRAGLVCRLTADELARVDAGFRFERDGRHPFRGLGIGVPTLQAVLLRFPAVRTIVEMKGSEPELARAVARVVRGAGAVDRVCVGSFHQSAIDALRAEAPEIVTSASQPEARRALHRSWVRWRRVRAYPYVAFQIPERAGRLPVVSRNFIHHIHREGQVVQIWVVDTAPDAMRLFAWGADGLITDRPDVTVPARDDWEKTHAR